MESKGSYGDESGASTCDSSSSFPFPPFHYRMQRCRSEFPSSNFNFKILFATPCLAGSLFLVGGRNEFEDAS